MPDGSLSRPPARQEEATSIRPLRGLDLKVQRQGALLLDVPEIAIDGEGLSVVMGANGAGKSLLLKVLAGLIAPSRGRVLWGASAPQRRLTLRLGFVFQKPVLLRRSALANVTYALKAAGMASGAVRERALAVLEEARLAAVAKRPARVLSGGEQQRLALARALALEPEVLFLDEPTASLDPASTLAIEEMVLRARAAGTRIVLVCHDAGQAHRLADEVIFMHAGRLIERGPAAEVFARPKSRQARAYLAGEIVL